MFDENKKIKILVADFHWVVRTGIITTLEKELKNVCIEETNSIINLKKTLIHSNFDVLILDYYLGDETIKNELKFIKKIAPDTKIIIFPYNLNYQQFFQINSFVHAIVSKQSNEKILIESIKCVLNGYENFVAGINSESLQKFLQLTKRELEVAFEFAQGKTNKEIVFSLNIKESTISTLKNRVMQKLHLNNYFEFVNFFNKSIM